MRSETFELSVPRPGLDEAFRLVRKLCKPKRGEEAVLSFDGACLHIECAGMTVTPGAQGVWSGQVRIPADFLLLLAKLPPSGDPLPFSVKDARLHVGSLSVGCTIQAAWSKAIELPMNATSGQILALHFAHTPEEIEAAGYSKTVEDAKSRADAQIEKAAQQLHGLLVEPEELRNFVYSNLKRKALEGLAPE
jgi:hypothetical protein